MRLLPSTQPTGRHEVGEAMHTSDEFLIFRGFVRKREVNVSVSITGA